MTVEKMIANLRSEEKMDFSTSFSYAQTCSVFLNDDDCRDDGRKLIIHILDNWSKIPEETKSIWISLVEAAGFYPYIQKSLYDLGSTAARIRKEIHKSKMKEIFLHEEQRTIKDKILSGKNIVVSAPTSFGKSLLLEEIVAEYKYSNIVVIQPTLALLDETRKKLKKYSSRYNFIIRTSQAQSKTKKNIFLCTPERVLEYGRFENIDFVVLDEFYKISKKRDDERAIQLNNAFYFLLNKFSPKFLMIGPNINKISQEFLTKYSAEFFKTNYSLVDNIEDTIENIKKEDLQIKLFELLDSIKNEQTLIYCSSPLQVKKISYEFYLFRKSRKYEQRPLSISAWINENIHPRWSLSDMVALQIGFHDGQNPKHINSSLINYFNEKKIQYLFCTSTIIEGVNTSAKHVIIFQNKKGNKNLDYFDYMNIKGRAGRLMKHYVGEVHSFIKKPQEKNIEIDIPFVDQNEGDSTFPSEIEIYIDDVDIKNKKREQYIYLSSIPEKLKNILRKNCVSIEGQVKIIEKLKEQISIDPSLVLWNRYPNNKQLSFLIKLCWENLLVKGETTYPMSVKKLPVVTQKYSISKNIKLLIDATFKYYQGKNNEDEQRTVNKAVSEVFNIHRHWFQYKLPKWLRVMNNLQNFVCDELSMPQVDYCFYASLLENDFLDEHFAIISEFGVPVSAIRKIAKYFQHPISEDQLVDQFKLLVEQHQEELTAYELERIRDVL